MLLLLCCGTRKAVVVNVGFMTTRVPWKPKRETVLVKTLSTKIVASSHALISTTGAGFPPLNKFRGFQPEELDD